MDRTEFTLTLDARQEQPALSPEDRRLLLGASLRVLGHRYVHGRPIFKEDVARVAALADDAAMETVAG